MTFRQLLSVVACLCLGWVAARGGEPAGPPTQREAEFFEAKVRPVLAEHCWNCHGPRQAEGRPAARLAGRRCSKGGDNGPVVVPGDPDKSLLIQAVRQTRRAQDAAQGASCRREAVDALAAWVKMGVPWPAADAAATPHADAWKRHWAFQPVRNRAAAGSARTPPGRARPSIASSWRSWKRRG